MQSFCWLFNSLKCRSIAYLSCSDLMFFEVNGILFFRPPCLLLMKLVPRAAVRSLTHAYPTFNVTWVLWNKGKVRNRPRSICFAAQGGNYTKSRPGGRRVELWRQPRVSLILFFLVTFRYFVSEMVLTCTVSIYIICKYGNGEIFTQSEEENGSRHL